MNIEEAKHLKEHGFYEKNGKKITWDDVKGDELKDAVLGFVEQFERGEASTDKGDKHSGLVIKRSKVVRDCRFGYAMELAQVVPTISIIITGHNYGAYVDQCIQSVMHNTLEPHEIIYVDDASEDDTAEQVKKYDRVNYHRVEYKNSSLTRNYGAEIASGEFLLFIDGDDYISRNFLRSAWMVLKDQTKAFAYPSMKLFGDAVGRVTAPLFHAGRITEKNYACISSVVRKRVFDQMGGFDPELPKFRDWDLWWRIVKAGWKGGRTDGILYYRKHERGMSAKVSTEDYTAVVRKNAEITIFTAFDDRPGVIDKYLDSLTHLGYPRKKVHLWFLDNSQNPRISDQLRGYLDSVASEFASTRYQALDLPPIMRDPDNPFTREVFERVAMLYQTMARGLGTELVLIWECDVTAAPDALDKLVGAMDAHTGAAAAAVKSKRYDGLQAWHAISFQPFRIDWEGGRVTPKTQDTLEIDASAWSMLLTRSHRLQQTVVRSIGQPYGFDTTYGRDIAMFGLKYKLVPSFATVHWQDADTGYEFTPPSDVPPEK